MKEVLILNLTRMGDLIQTTPVMRGLKEAHPEVKITLVINSLFSGICSYIPYIDRLIIFDMHQFQSLLYSEGTTLVDHYSYLERFMEQINEYEYDVAINFTHSRASAVLLSLANAREKRGFTIDAEGYSIIRYPWMKYFFNVIPNRDLNPFHLCDIYVKSSGIVPEKKGLHLTVPESAGEGREALLEKHGVKKDDLVVGFQLGASTEDKRWSAQSFAKLGDRLAREFNAKILLVGSATEVSLGKEYESAAEVSPINFIGKTDLKELAGLLARCNLFVSNDTGPLHIATAVGTKVIDISVASVHFRETGPYGESCYVIQSEIPCCPCNFLSNCKSPICKEAVSPECVFEVAMKLLTEGDIASIEEMPLWNNVQVYRPFFDQHGLIDYRPLIKRSLKKELLYIHMYRESWLAVLDTMSSGDMDISGYAISAVAEKISSHLVNRIKEWYNSDISEDSLACMNEELDGLRQLKEFAEEGLLRVSLIAQEAKKAAPDVERIRNVWEGVPGIDESVQMLGSVHASFHPLTLFFEYGKKGLEGKELTFLAEETCKLYRELMVHASLLSRLIERHLASSGASAGN